MKKIFALMIVAAFAFGCKNAAQNQPADSNENAGVTEQTVTEPEAKPKAKRTPPWLKKKAEEKSASETEGAEGAE